MTDKMTPAEHKASEVLIRVLHYAIQGHDPGIAAHALGCVLAGTIATFAADPLRKARSVVADELIATWDGR
jgi:hypothetical protein